MTSSMLEAIVKNSSNECADVNNAHCCYFEAADVNNARDYYHCSDGAKCVHRYNDLPFRRYCDLL
jgi:hypothetical protein